VPCLGVAILRLEHGMVPFSINKRVIFLTEIEVLFQEEFKLSCIELDIEMKADFLM
jgi:hypothetical protein